jgi:hypothetical protein
MRRAFRSSGLAATRLVPAQITQAVYSQSVGILDTLVGKRPDVTRQRTAELVVELPPGHATVDVDRSGNRLCNLFD